MSRMGRVRPVLAAIVLVLIGVAAWAKTESPNAETAKHLPDEVGSFKTAGPAIPQMPSQYPHLFDASAVFRTYVAGDGSRYTAELQIAANDAAAFALLTQARSYFAQFPGADCKLAFDDVGTASFTRGSQIFFYKGSVFASVTPDGESSAEKAKELALGLAAPLSPGEDEIPVLLKHLPNAETALRTAVYSVSLEDL